LEWILVKCLQGRVFGQAGCRPLPTAAASVQAWDRALAFLVYEAAQRQAFSEFFGFPLKSLHRLLHTLIIINHPGLVQ
jgi:hypothetical protein